ncbi:MULTISPECIES: thioesterase II family protein [unclassified Micromonospora]|uniref:thioesterase II family protein n=1 Tax=unclassified Micromonospora TaxID=2617518 RepID=UPI0036419639
MDEPERWLRRWWERTDDAQVTLVCLPHAGGSASSFVRLARGLPTAIDTVAVQYPGRQDRHAEPAVPSVAALADRVAEVLVERPSPLPTVLLGHSMGAVVAYEAALRLAERGAEPAGLIASAARAPVLMRRNRTDPADDHELLEEMRQLSGTEAMVFEDEKLLQLVLPPLRNDMTAIETYVASTATVNCPIGVFVGDRDPVVTVAEARRWSEVTTGGSRLQVFPGGHFYLTEPGSTAIGAIARRALSFVAASSPR